MTTPQPSKPHPLNRLWRYAARHRQQTILAITCSILNKVFDLAPPILIGAAVDVVVAQQDSIVAQFGFPEVSTQLWILAILTVIIWGLESTFEYAFSYLWRNLAQTLQHELRVETYGHVQTLEMAYFEDRSTGGLMAVLNDDINQLERFLDIGANEVLQVLTTVVVIGIMFFALAPSVAWMSFLPMPFIFWGSMRFQKEIAPRYAEVRERVGQLNGQLSNNLSGIATIKSFTAEKFEVGRIENESDNYRTSNRKAIKLSSAFVPLIRMIIVMGFVATLVFGGNLVIQGSLNAKKSLFPVPKGFGPTTCKSLSSTTSRLVSRCLLPGCLPRDLRWSSHLAGSARPSSRSMSVLRSLLVALSSSGTRPNLARLSFSMGR